MKEDDAMVYRNPYLTSGASGFALNAISRAMKKELKVNLLLIIFDLNIHHLLFGIEWLFWLHGSSNGRGILILAESKISFP